MRTFATPGLRLDCALSVGRTYHCPWCGLPQIGPVAARLHVLLGEADTLMRQLDSERAPVLAPAVAPSPQMTGPTQPAPPPLQRPAFPLRVERRRAPVSVGSVVLALGALCLVVAAVVFVAVTWGSLSLSTRTLVLLGATGVAFATTARLTVRRLHTSVEALSAVSWLFLAVDVAAARATGLLGLDRLALVDLVTLSGVLAAVPASVAAVLARRMTGREPYVTSIVATGGWWLIAASVAVRWELDTAWRLVVLVLAGATLSLGYRAVGSQIPFLLLAGTTLLLHGVLWVEALGLALASDVDVLLRTGRVWLVLVTMGLTVAAAELARRRNPGERADAVVLAAGVAATLLAGALAVAPAWRSDPPIGVIALFLVTVALAATGLVRPRPWTRGPRALVAVAASGCLLVALPWIARLGVDLAALLEAPWSHPVDAELPGLGAYLRLATGLPPWTATLGLLTLAVASWIVAAWDEALLPASALRSGSLLVVWAAGVLTLCLATASLPIAVASLVLPGLVLLGLHLLCVGSLSTTAPVLGAAPAGGCVLAGASVGLSLLTWSACLAAAALMALGSRDARAVGAWAAASVVLGAGVTAAVVDLLGGGVSAQALALALVLALTLLATAAPSSAPSAWLRRGITAAVAGLSLLPVLLAVDVGLARTSLVLTVLGAAAAAVGIVDAQRRLSAVVGALTLAPAWWLRLVASDIDVVEAYTVLPAAVLLTVGLVAVLRRAAPTVPSMLPGLTLAIAPSLPLALTDPGSPRALLLLAAAAALLAGGTALRWAAPFAAGAAVVALLAIVHLGPYVEATPRWAALATLGLVMLAVGVTWESRVRDLRSAAAYVGALR